MSLRRWSLTRPVISAVVVSGVACPSPPDLGESTETSIDASGSTTVPSGSSATGSSSGASATLGSSTSADTGTTLDPSTSVDDTGTTTGTPAGPGCPADPPASWILCEDFDTPGDPSAYFGFFTTTADLLAVESTDAWSGQRALRIGHDPGIFASGMADVRFGQGPAGGMVHAPDEVFREIWVRFHLKTESGWPDAGIAEAVEVMSVTGNGRTIAVDATIYSPTQAQAQALAWSCVHDSQLLCDGLDDWANPSLEVRESGLGTSALYGTAAAGQWQCHEIHVRLDDPGRANGIFEVFVDDQPEVSLSGITYVDAWAEAGINNVRFASFWNAPAVLDHHIDDVVVATAPIGCPGR